MIFSFPAGLLCSQVAVPTHGLRQSFPIQVIHKFYSAYTSLLPKSSMPLRVPQCTIASSFLLPKNPPSLTSNRLVHCFCVFAAFRASALNPCKVIRHTKIG